MDVLLASLSVTNATLEPIDYMVRRRAPSRTTRSFPGRITRPNVATADIASHSIGGPGANLLMPWYPFNMTRTEANAIIAADFASLDDERVMTVAGMMAFMADLKRR